MSPPGRLSVNRPVFSALLAVAVLAPLPLGAYADWAWATIAAACGALLLCWGISVLAGRTSLAAPTPMLLYSGTALALVLLWVLVQGVAFTPEAWHHPLWREAADALGAPYRGAVSLDPVAGRDGALRIASYAAVFWLAFQYGQNPVRARLGLGIVAAACACYALYGLGALHAGWEHVLWFEKTAYRDAATATFVNPNSFATYCGIGLLCATAVLGDRHEDHPRDAKLVARLGALFRRFTLLDGAMIAAWAVLAAALPATLSRGGVAATGLALLVHFWVVARGRGARLRTVAERAAVLAAAAWIVLLFAGQGLERRLWDVGDDWEKRSEIYAVTARAVAERPLAGTGLGTFEPVYRSHRTAEVRPGVRMAHNDYLELALELGIPATLLLVSAVAAPAAGCARGVRARRRHRAIAAVGISAAILVGTHSMVDFSLQIPAVAVTFCLVLGLASAQSRPTRARASPGQPDA